MQHNSLDKIVGCVTERDNLRARLRASSFQEFVSQGARASLDRAFGDRQIPSLGEQVHALLAAQFRDVLCSRSRSCLQCMVIVVSDHVAAQLACRDQQGCGIGASGNCDHDPIAGTDQVRSANAKQKRFGGIWGQHGGAGWTRTSDNAIMSRALYHLSYGTAGRRRARRARSGKRSYRAACARAFSLRFLVRRFASATRFLLFTALQNKRSRGARLRGLLQMVAEVGFEPTTFGL